MSDAIRIELPENPPAYQPRQELLGTLTWKRVKPFSRIELHLLWYTTGKGDREVTVVETLEWKDPGAEGDRFFEIRLPRAPYSINSDNLQIHWRLEACGYPGKDQATLDLVVAPHAKVLKLESAEDSDGGWTRFRRWLGLGTQA